MLPKSLLIQIIGGLAILLWVISVQEKKQYKILFLQALANLLYTVQYFLLGIFTAGSMSLVSFGRCFLLYIKRKKEKEISKSHLIVSIIILIILGAITYESLLSLIPIVITIFYTISSYMKNSQWLRIIFLIAAFIWIYYNYIVGAYVCIIGNVLEIISGTISIIRFHKNS